MTSRCKIVGPLAFLISLIIFTACGNNQNKANLLNPDVKYRADTMFAHHRADLYKELDSLCTAKMPELIEAAKDSLIQSELQLIEKIRNR